MCKVQHILSRHTGTIWAEDNLCLHNHVSILLVYTVQIFMRAHLTHSAHMHKAQNPLTKDKLNVH